MSTLGQMKEDVAAACQRPLSSISDTVAAAISRAIRKYRDEPFWFAQSRNLLITTAADTNRYTALDAGSDVDTVAEVTKVIEAFVYDGDPADFEADRMRWIDPGHWEQLADSGGAVGDPYNYSRLDDELLIYPTPTGANWTIRLLGYIRVAEPADDDEADNPWMTHARALIEAEAVRRVAIYKLRDFELAAMMEREAAREKGELYGEGGLIMGSGLIEPDPCLSS